MHASTAMSSQATAPLHFETLAPQDLRAYDRDAWLSLCEAEPAFRSPLLGPDFAELVGSVRTDVAVAVARRAGRPVAFFAHHRRPGGVARPLGAPFSDIHAVVSGPDLGLSGPEFLRRSGVRRFPFTSLIDPYCLFSSVEQTPAPGLVIEVPADASDGHWAAVEAAEKKHFKKTRRWRARLEAEFGRVELVAGDLDEAAFDQVLRWKREQLARTGLHDVLRPLWVDALMRSAFRCRGGAFRGQMFTLRAGGRVVAARFGVALGQAWHPWIATYDPAFADFGPGHLLMWEIIKAMPGLGLTTYELGGGLADQKRRFATSEQPMVSGVAVCGGAPALHLNPSLGRLSRRLDQIAVTDLDFAGRTRGLISALAAAPRRWRAA